ncbi:MAG: hypothetical protein RSB70_02600 [Clostridium sp.]
MNTYKSPSLLLAYGAIITTLSILALYLSSIISINTIFFLGLASCLIPLGVMLTNIKTGFIIYMSVTLLSFFLISDKSLVMFYGFFFGIYGLVKFYIENLNKTLLELILKFLFFNVSFALMYFIYENLFTNMISSILPVYALVIIAQIGFLSYDYIITLFIAYVIKNILPKIQKLK